MEYRSIREMAKKWKMDEHTVRRLCANGVVSGAVHDELRWKIPSDAIRPTDTKYTRDLSTLPYEPYKFPLLYHTPAYQRPSSLDTAERVLFDAQTYFLSGDFGDSSKLCRKLINEENLIYLKAGAFSTLAYDANFLGNYDEMDDCVKGLEKIVAEEEFHTEDYRLMLADLYAMSWNFDPFLQIDPEELSRDALIFYSLSMARLSVYDAAKGNRSYLTNINILTQLSEHDQLFPTAVTFHAILGCHYQYKGYYDKMNEHIERACELAIRNNLYGQLARFVPFIRTPMELALKKFGNSVYRRVLNTAATIKKGFCGNMIRQGNPASVAELDDNFYQILALLPTKQSMREIAALTEMTEEELTAAIQSSCSILNLGSVEELIGFAKTYLWKTPNIYDTMNDKNE